MNKSAMNLYRARERGKADANTGALCPYNPGSARADAWESGRQAAWREDDLHMSRATVGMVAEEGF